ncbi:MAG: O-succinylhomoserine sulfhydrylase [Proteobacteria bacterium]|nr:O-succinylhomoserine sulfhydrylase [Pseudomonadota bacterium]MBI3499115.1 O-succinylhomoserine sulfhydrylase [Pseudomonadota bacterium]
MADDSSGERANTKAWRPRTAMVRAGLKRSQHMETCEALYMTSGFVYGDAEEAERAFAQPTADRYVYSRFRNPTVSAFEERACHLEGAEAARSTASGMAAVFASLLCQLKSGDRVVAARALFGSCLYILSDLLPRWGIETVLVDGRDLKAWKKALDRPTKVVFLETPSNPMLEIIDLEAVGKLARKVGAQVIVDNVFATGLLQRPLEVGADVIVYSATKHIDGQGRGLGGIVMGRKAFIEDTLAPFLRHTGPSLSPFNAWLMLKGLETLDLRLRTQCAAAAEIARFLEGEKAIGQTLYPGLASHPQQSLAKKQMTDFGSVVTFTLKGGREAAFRLVDRLSIIDISNNLGDSKSLICHPATTTHQRLPAEEKLRLGIAPGTLRLSVGLEDPADLKADLKRALKGL